MTRRRVGLAVLLIFVVVISGTIALAGIGGAQSIATSGTAQGEPDLDVHLPQDTVLPGERSQIDIQLSNNGKMDWGSANYQEIVTSARNVRVEMEAEGPLEVQGGEMAIGTVTTNKPRNVPLTLKVPVGTDPGTYDIDIDIKYLYTDTLWLGSTRVDEDTESISKSVEVEVDNAPRFSIENATTDVRIGDRDTMAVTLENTGSQTAEDVRLSLESSSAKFLFGQSKADTSRVSTLEPGSNTTLKYDVTVPPEASLREFSLSGTVQYTDPDGLTGVHEGLSTGVTPLPEQTFDVGSIESTLRVGEDGEITGTIKNTGPEDVGSVVVRYADDAATLIPIEQSAAVGSLDSGESASFSLPIEVNSEAEDGSKSIDMAVSYRNTDDEKRLYDKLEVLADVAPERDQFEVALTDRTIESGGSTTISVEVTNNLDETVSDVEGRLFADDPLDTGSTDTGYVESLEPGETATMIFELTAESSAVAEKSYPISFDFRYDDADGDSKLSDTTRVAMTVVEPTDDGSGLPLPLIGGGIVLIVLIGGGYYYLRDQ